MTDPQKIFDGLRQSLGDAVAALDGSGDDGTILLKHGSIRAALEALKADGFNMLVDLTAADYSRFGQGASLPASAANSGASAARPALAAGSVPEGARFKLTYRLMSLDPIGGLARGRIALQSWVEGEHGPRSVRDLWPNADWLEREVWDMFGVRFADRHEMRRMLLYEEFIGHPLRKDYPIKKRQPLIGPKEDKPRDRMTQADLRPKVTP